MKFFDATVSYGDEAGSAVNPVKSIDTLQKALERAGIENAAVFHHSQDHACMRGNEQVAEDIAGKKDLHGIWALLPESTGETPAADVLPQLMQKNRIIGLRFNPAKQHFLWPHGAASYLAMAQARRIPVFVNTLYDLKLEDAWKMLEAFPDLVTVFSFSDCWPGDRWLRPFLEKFPHFYLSLTNQMTQYGLESLVEWRGAKRLLFGSDYPNTYFGGQMMQVLQAKISDADKEDIAHKNMERILSEVNWS